MPSQTVVFQDILLGEFIFEPELIDFLANAESFYPVQKFDSTRDFLLNLIVALCHDQPITLVDKDFSDQELVELDLFGAIGVVRELRPLGQNWNQNWLQAILNSRSKITLFTSGTTGLPKQVEHSITSLTRMVRTGARYAEDKWVLAYNPTHMAGMQVLFQALLNRNEIINVFGLSAEKAAMAIQDSQASHLSATPTFYRILTGTGKVFDHIRRVTVGGEKSGKNLHQKIRASFPQAKLNNIYASTELGSLFVSEGEKFKVLEHLKGQVRVGDDGELLLHPSLLANNNNEKEWYATGDLVEILKENPLEFRFLSRKTEMINVGGYKVNPNEVESVLEQFPKVLRCRVFGKANSVLGNVLCAEVQMKTDTEIDKRAIQLFLKETLQNFKIPRIIKKVASIETTRTGKITRKS